MRIVILGDGLFVKPLLTLGVEVLHLSPDSTDTPFPLEAWTSVEINKYLRNGDILLISGAISPVIFPADLAAIEVPVCCFLPDSPLHHFWMQHAASSLDMLFVDQPHDVARYQHLVPTYWLPLASDLSIYHPGDTAWSERDIDFLFVGTIDKAKRPKRSALLERIQKSTPVTIVDGAGTRAVPASEVADYYRRAKVIINENMFPSVNLRLFEAMGSGALVFTESVDRCWEQLFTDGEHLIAFDAINIDEKICWIQNHPEQAATIANNGSTAIANQHTQIHRAEKFLELLSTIQCRRKLLTSREFAATPVQMLLRWQSHPQQQIWSQGALPLLESATNFSERTWLNRAIMMTHFNRIPDAITALKAALQKYPDSHRIRIALGWLLLSNNESSGYSHLRIALTGLLGTGCDVARIKTDRGYLHYQSALALIQLGLEYDAGFARQTLPTFLWNAMEHFMATLTICPDEPHYRIEFASFLEKLFAVEETGILLEAAPTLSDSIKQALSLLAPKRY